MSTPTTAAQIIGRLGLLPHPEGGHYRETWRDREGVDGRAHASAIYYLLRAGEESRWHRVDASEVWHFYAGAPLALCLSPDGRRIEDRVLGTDLEGGQEPQHVVPAGVWQSARTLGDWTLVGCTVAPGFEFAGFVLAAHGWEPAGA